MGPKPGIPINDTNDQEKAQAESCYELTPQMKKVAKSATEDQRAKIAEFKDKAKAIVAANITLICEQELDSKIIRTFQESAAHTHRVANAGSDQTCS